MTASAALTVGPDFQITNHGTIWTFTPLTCAASDWWQDNVENGPSFGRAFAVEHRMAEPILAAIQQEGFCV